MKRLLPLLALLLTLLLASCSDDSGFTVKMKITDLRDREVRSVYFNGMSIVASSRQAPDGTVNIYGRTTDPTLLNVTLVDGTRLATLIVKNGDEIEVALSADNPYEVNMKGSDQSAKLLKFYQENSRLIETNATEELNLKVAQFIGSHKSDLASTALLVTQFSTPEHEHQADSLLRLISPDAKPRPLLNNFQNQLSSQLSGDVLSHIQSMSFYNNKDSLVRFNPRRQSVGLLAFLDDGSGRSTRKSDISQLNELYERYNRKRFEAMEFTVAVDSFNWQLSLRGDSVGWQRVWTPAVQASPKLKKIAVPAVPFFIVVDSTGEQLLRTRSMAHAAEMVNSLLSAK